MLGVDWGVPTCGSPGACGFLNPAHTASGGATLYTPPSSIPSGATVIVVAKSTANPSATATVTITIAPPPPIAVAVTPAAASVQVKGTAQLTATVTNDLAGLGADWTVSCGSAGACGSVTAHAASGKAATYTAPGAVPAGGTVTVTATSTSDNTKSASSTITIVPLISIAFTPAPPTSVIAGTPANFTATVTNDMDAAGVDWTVSCANAPCGAFSSGHTASGAATAFTAPIGAPSGSVTIVASSTASGAALPVRSVSATVTVVPVVAVNFVPYAPSQMQVSTLVNNVVTSAPVSLTAAVTNDATNAGADWSACGSTSTSQVSCGGAACGLFQVIPAIAATSTTPAVNAVCATTAHTASGQAVLYIPPSQPPTPGGTVAISAKAHNPAATSSLATAAAVVNIVATPSGVQLNGVVMAGANPVAGAAVSLYAAGTTGYSSAASALEISGSSTQVVSGTAGQFAIPAGYTCPSQSSQMYLVALGGNAGGGTNPNLAMMTALGPCGGLSSAANITINEVTTVGSIWPLAPFMANYAHVGSSSTNANAGMASAFAAVNNLVNISTGQALAITPAGNGVVPQSEINTLADILNTCSVTSGGAVGDGSPCGAMFSAANPSTTTSNAPTNTLQAALNIAQNPSYNTITGQTGITVYSLLPANRPFTPVLATAPNDWTISLSFTGGGLGGSSRTNSQSSAFAIDGFGNIWIANNGINSVTELNNLGAALSPPTTGTTLASAGGYKGGGLNSPNVIAIDPLGNAWVANGNGTLTVLSPTGSAMSPTQGFSGGGLQSSVQGLAVDGLGNIWAVNASYTGSVSWFAGTNATINGVATPSGTPLSPSAGLTQGISDPTGAIGIDTSGTVWVLNSGSESAAGLSSSNGSFIQSDYGYMSTVPAPFGSVLSQGSIGTSVAIDSAGDVFLTLGNELAELLAGGSSANDGGLGKTSNASSISYSGFLASDGASHIWLLITGGAVNCPSATSVVEMNIGGQLNANPLGCGYLGPSSNPNDSAIGVDGSGNVWVLSPTSATELIGVATPVVTPFSLGVQNKTLGKRP